MWTIKSLRTTRSQRTFLSNLIIIFSTYIFFFAFNFVLLKWFRLFLYQFNCLIICHWKINMFHLCLRGRKAFIAQFFVTTVVYLNIIYLITDWYCFPISTSKCQLYFSASLLKMNHFPYKCKKKTIRFQTNFSNSIFFDSLTFVG